MSGSILSFVIDADIAKSSGMTDHPVSSSSRKVLDSVLASGHKMAMCPTLRKEWKDHKSKYATRWLASMVAKKKVIFCIPATQIKDYIELQEAEGKNKDVALKDAHLLDSALLADRIIASNDNKAREVFCEMSDRNGVIGTLLWFNAVTDREFFCGPLMNGDFIPKRFYLSQE